MAKEQLIQALKHDLANFNVLWVKLHNYHWNIQGVSFFTLHEQTQTFYEYIGGMYDDVAERILQLGEKPTATLEAYLANTRIKEDPREAFGPQDVLEGVRADFEAILDSANEVHAIASECGDTATLNLYEDHIQTVGKYRWMVNQAAAHVPTA